MESSTKQNKTKQNKPQKGLIPKKNHSPDEWRVTSTTLLTPDNDSSSSSSSTHYPTDATQAARVSVEQQVPIRECLQSLEQTLIPQNARLQALDRAVYEFDHRIESVVS